MKEVHVLPSGQVAQFNCVVPRMSDARRRQLEAQYAEAAAAGWPDKGILYRLHYHVTSIEYLRECYLNSCESIDPKDLVDLARRVRNIQKRGTDHLLFDLFN